jgi:hypothetical protein
MLSDFLAKNIKSQAGLEAGGYVTYGYGQVEPNHLSAQRTGQIYAQLPANKDIDVLENGQFVKYDYAAANGGEVNFTGKGEWMLVFNEIKLYREHQMDCEFAMKKGDYVARIYSPVDADTNFDAQSRYYGGKDAEGNDIEKVTAPADMYELHYNENPFHIESQTTPRKMPVGTTMVPRVFKTNFGDIMTTNMVKEATLALGDELAPNAQGILAKNGDKSAMVWQVVKVYTLPDHQKAVKIMRIA